ncbi:MAG: hypothetical protein Q4E88_06285 [Coriobacteriia bacterium]|nr:hypothetical protein [Coriobacteriia bacterium]
MKNFLKKPNVPLIIIVSFIVILCIVFSIVCIVFVQGTNSLATQQRWASGKESFDNAYEIAAADKDTPDKTLYIPKLTEFLGKNVSDAVASLGSGASVISSTSNQVIVNLTNEAANVKSGSTTISFDLNKEIVKCVHFRCNTWALGYGALSFTDLINNEHCIEKSLNEAGLNLEYGSVIAPTNRSTYTSYAADGVTVEKESFTFHGRSGKYNWEANMTFDYSIANTKGNLADTVRTIEISIS